jgi:hypothetical protein
LAKVDPRVSVVSSWLLDASCSCSVGVLIHGRLHLLQKLIDVHQIILSSQVWKRQSILVLWHRTTVTSVMAVDWNH